MKATITIEYNEETKEVDVFGECDKPEGDANGVHLIFLYLSKNMDKVIADACEWMVNHDGSR